jgi:late competence protein required for DNA uptake (superfamily II DNA/RNA helicase)
MASEMWNVYGITEDEYIECCRCSEKLENLGFEFDEKLLNCNSCVFCGRCTVTRENMFLGSKTC